MRLNNLQLYVQAFVRGDIMKIKTYTSEELKNRLLNIGEAIGQIAFDYIVELEKEIDELKNVNIHDESKKKKRWRLYSMMGE